MSRISTAKKVSGIAAIDSSQNDSELLLMTRSRSRELQRQSAQQQHHQRFVAQPDPTLTAMYADQDTRSVLQGIGGTDYPAPTSFDDVLPEDIKRISKIQRFRLQAVLADANDAFAALERYTCNGEFFWCITVDSMSSPVWKNLIAVDDTYLYIGRFTVKTKRARHIGDIMKGITSLPCAPTFEPGIYVDVWRYRTFGERDYVARLCAADSTA